MAIDYSLTLAEDIPVEQIADRTLPNPAERFTLTWYEGILTGDFYDQYGFGLSFYAGQHRRYIEAETDEGVWVWEPEVYVGIGFGMDKEQLDKGVPNMVSIVARVLASTSGDAALTLNGEVLLARVNGVVVKHKRSIWWDHYSYPNEVIPG